MRNTGKRTASWALTAACSGAIGAAGLLLTTGGCNKMENVARQRDRDVDKALADSAAHRDSGGDKGATDALNDLKKAAAVSDASNAAKVRAKSELAGEELDKAMAQLPEINRRTLQIEQALWDLRQAGMQIQATQ